MNKYLKPSDFLMEDEKDNPFSKEKTNLKKEEPKNKPEIPKKVEPTKKVEQKPIVQTKKPVEPVVKTKIKKVLVKDKELTKKVDDLTANVEKTYNKIVNNMDKMIDVFTKKMDNLQKDVYAVKEPSNEEKFATKINAGKPFNMTLKDYFGTVDEEQEEEKEKEYIAKLSDVVDGHVGDDVKSDLGLNYNYYTRNKYNR